MKYKNYILIGVVLILTALFTGCPQEPELPPPTEETEKPVDPIPKNLALKNSDTTYIVISWSAVRTAEKYVIERSTTNQEEDFIMNKLIVNASEETIYKDNNITPGQLYYYRIKSIINGVESDPSTSIEAKTSGVPKPEGFNTVSYSGNEVQFTFNEVQGATEYVLFSSDGVNTNPLEVERYPASAGGDKKGVLITHQKRHIDGVLYYYTLKSINMAGEFSSPTAEKVIKVGQNIPLNFMITLSGNDYISLQWDEVSTTKAETYRLYRADSRNGHYNKVADIYNRTDFRNYGLAPARTYYYKISAVIDGNESQQSAAIEGNTTPNDPHTIQAMNFTEDSVMIGWKMDGDALGYYINVVDMDKLYALPDKTEIDNLLATPTATVPSNKLTHEVIGLLPGTLYAIYVRAYIVNENNEYIMSSVTQTPKYFASLLDPVTNFQLTDFTKSSIKLEWTDNDKADGYRIIRAQDPNFTIDLVSKNISRNGSPVTSFIDDREMKPFTQYYYKIFATKTITKPTTQIVESSRGELKDKFTMLDEPKNIIPTEYTDSSITLTWDKVVGGDKYMIYRKGPNQTNYSLIKTITHDQISEKVSYTDTTCADYKEYSYKIKASNDTHAGYTSELSVEKTGHTRIKTPTNFKTANVQDKTLTLIWDSISGDPIDSKIYTYMSHNNGPWTEITPALLKTRKKRDVSGLLESSTYQFKMIVKDTNNTTDYDSIEVLSDIVRTKMAAVTGLAVDNGTITTDSATINWTSHPQATKYVIKVYDSVYVDTPKFTREVTAPTTSYNLAGLTVGDKNRVVIMAVDTTTTPTETESGEASIDIYTCPGDPGTLTIGLNSADKSHLDMSWGASSGVNVKYELINVTAGNSKTDVATNSKTVTTGLASLTDYTFDVKAYILDGSNNRVYSPNSSGPQSQKTGLATPTGFSASQISMSPIKVKLTWNTVNGASGYKVYRNNIFIDEVGSSSNFFEDSPTAGVHDYKIEAINGTSATSYGATFDGLTVIENTNQ